jgi:hypothetical protein
MAKFAGAGYAQASVVLPCNGCLLVHDDRSDHDKLIVHEQDQGSVYDWLELA